MSTFHLNQRKVLISRFWREIASSQNFIMVQGSGVDYIFL